MFSLYVNLSTCLLQLINCCPAHLFVFLCPPALSVHPSSCPSSLSTMSFYTGVPVHPSTFLCVLLPRLPVFVAVFVYLSTSFLSASSPVFLYNCQSIAACLPLQVLYQFCILWFGDGSAKVWGESPDWQQLMWELTAADKFLCGCSTPAPHPPGLRLDM